MNLLERIAPLVRSIKPLASLTLAGIAGCSSPTIIDDSMPRTDLEEVLEDAQHSAADTPQGISQQQNQSLENTPSAGKIDAKTNSRNLPIKDDSFIDYCAELAQLDYGGRSFTDLEERILFDAQVPLAAVADYSAIPQGDTPALSVQEIAAFSSQGIYPDYIVDLLALTDTIGRPFYSLPDIFALGSRNITLAKAHAIHSWKNPFEGHTFTGRGVSRILNAGASFEQLQSFQERGFWNEQHLIEMLHEGYDVQTQQLRNGPDEPIKLTQDDLFDFENTGAQLYELFAFLRITVPHTSRGLVNGVGDAKGLHSAEILPADLEAVVAALNTVEIREGFHYDRGVDYFIKGGGTPELAKAYHELGKERSLLSFDSLYAAASWIGEGGTFEEAERLLNIANSAGKPLFADFSVMRDHKEKKIPENLLHELARCTDATQNPAFKYGSQLVHFLALAQHNSDARAELEAYFSFADAQKDPFFGSADIFHYVCLRDGHFHSEEEGTILPFSLLSKSTADLAQALAGDSVKIHSDLQYRILAFGVDSSIPLDNLRLLQVRGYSGENDSAESLLEALAKDKTEHSDAELRTTLRISKLYHLLDNLDPDRSRITATAEPYAQDVLRRMDGAEVLKFVDRQYSSYGCQIGDGYSNEDRAVRVVRERIQQLTPTDLQHYQRRTIPSIIEAGLDRDAYAALVERIIENCSQEEWLSQRAEYLCDLLDSISRRKDGVAHTARLHERVLSRTIDVFEASAENKYFGQGAYPLLARHGLRLILSQSAVRSITQDYANNFYSRSQERWELYQEYSRDSNFSSEDVQGLVNAWAAYEEIGENEGAQKARELLQQVPTRIFQFVPDDVEDVGFGSHLNIPSRLQEQYPQEVEALRQKVREGHVIYENLEDVRYRGEVFGQ